MRSIIALIFLALPALAAEPPKTNSSQPVAVGLLGTEPYRHNGLVLVGGGGRGSGFIVQDPHLFFTAAHVVFGESTWGPPPSWVGNYSDAGPPSGGVSSRGYFRWKQYTNAVTEFGIDSRNAFGRDIALAWGLDIFSAGTPATLDFKGQSNLRKPLPSIITGYPAILDYTEELGNFFLHTTEADSIPYKSGSRSASSPYLLATHISTGPGNSGGPVWSAEVPGTWKASGVLVSGRPSETGVYAITPAVKSFLRGVEPLIATPRRSTKSVGGVSSSSMLSVMKKPKNIPDGRQRWTKIPLSFPQLEEGVTVSGVKLNLTITTAHRGDLMVALMSPEGQLAFVHNGQGAGADNLILEDFENFYLADVDDLVGFEGSVPGGQWKLLVQDRLTGDLAVVTRCELELFTE
jgi:subtilisin-like proprotein convertase family protein